MISLFARKRKQKQAAAEVPMVAPEPVSETAFEEEEPGAPEQLAFSAGSAIDRGARDYQEDAVLTELTDDTGFRVVVLADGMGGHAAGNVASDITVRTISEGLKARIAGLDDSALDTLPGVIAETVMGANDAIGGHVADNPATRGMGTTVVAAVLAEGRIFWTSVGDSPLYLLRDNSLRQLNEDHSMAPQIDFMVKSGVLTPEQGADHPNRNCLTSALTGEAIPRIDTPEQGFALEAGDILVISSDGLQFLEEAEIARLVAEHHEAPAQEIADALMAAVIALRDPEQDNVSCVVIKVETSTMSPQDVAPATVDPDSLSRKRQLMLGD